MAPNETETTKEAPDTCPSNEPLSSIWKTTRYLTCQLPRMEIPALVKDHINPFTVGWTTTVVVGLIKSVICTRIDTHIKSVICTRIDTHKNYYTFKWKDTTSIVPQWCLITFRQWNIRRVTCPKCFLHISKSFGGKFTPGKKQYFEICEKLFHRKNHQHWRTRAATKIRQRNCGFYSGFPSSHELVAHIVTSLGLYGIWKGKVKKLACFQKQLACLISSCIDLKVIR